MGHMYNTTIKVAGGSNGSATKSDIKRKKSSSNNKENNNEVNGKVILDDVMLINNSREKGIPFQGIDPFEDDNNLNKTTDNIKWVPDLSIHPGFRKNIVIDDPFRSSSEMSNDDNDKNTNYYICNNIICSTNKYSKTSYVTPSSPTSINTNPKSPQCNNNRDDHTCNPIISRIKAFFINIGFKIKRFFAIGGKSTSKGALLKDKINGNPIDDDERLTEDIGDDSYTKNRKHSSKTILETMPTMSGEFVKGRQCTLPKNRDYRDKIINKPQIPHIAINPFPGD